MDYKAIVNLMKEMNQTDLTKLEIEKEGFQLKMEKGTSFVEQKNEKLENNIAVDKKVTEIEQVTERENVEKPSEVEEGRKILSPMVGTFYAKPSPDKPAYVKPGERVKKGQTLCIIEAMKLMNEIESEFEGEIIKVLVEDEEMVEYGQPLFVIK